MLNDDPVCTFRYYIYGVVNEDREFLTTKLNEEDTLHYINDHRNMWPERYHFYEFQTNDLIEPTKV